MSESGFVFIEPNVHLTPAQVEEFLIRLNNEIGVASDALIAARDREMDAFKIYTEERDKLLLSDECPRVGRNKGEVTTDHREAWIRSIIGDQFWLYETTTVQRKDAETHVWKLKDQYAIVQSLGVFSRLAYQDAGRSHR